VYVILEGQRRWTTAKLEGIKEIPCIVVNRMDEHDQVVVMFNVHANRRGWQMAEELTAIKELIEKNGHRSEEEMATELGVSLATFKDRLRVLRMGEEVVSDIAKGSIDYSSALRTDEVTDTLRKKRPELVDKLGGEKAIERKLLRKAKVRKGISQELVTARKDLGDTQNVPDDLVKEYIQRPEVSMREVLRRKESLAEQRKIEALIKDLRRLEREIRLFNVDLEVAPNLRELRRALSGHIDAAQALEERVFEALLRKEDEPGR
jgi:ParB/RepB/Spo0J family partition protein